MRRLISAVTAVAALATAPAATAQPARERGEAKLERLLEGRVPGRPQSCINLRPHQSSTIVSRTAIVYEGPGDIIYVNRPRSGADALTDFNVMVSRRPTQRLCRIDTIRMFDPASRALAGVVFLGDFVPYRKVSGRHRG